jgi:hypothetical protein
MLECSAIQMFPLLAVAVAAAAGGGCLLLLLLLGHWPLVGVHSQRIDIESGIST